VNNVRKTVTGFVLGELRWVSSSDLTVLFDSAVLSLWQVIGVPL
jgi:hypothetical protein